MEWGGWMFDLGFGITVSTLLGSMFIHVKMNRISIYHYCINISH